MGKIRKLTLEEWFLDYQLVKAWRENSHQGFHLDIDVTNLVQQVEAAELKFSPTAVLVKAVGLLAAEKPKLNRILLRTPFGSRILEPDTVGINMPVMVQNNGEPFLSGMIITSPEDRSAMSIQNEIRAYARGDISDKPVGRFVMTRKNTWYNRLALKLLYFMAYRIPSLHLRKGGGAFSVTSLIWGDASHLLSRGEAHGHTILTFVLVGMNKTESGRVQMMVGVGLNHSIIAGVEFQEACNVFTKILSSGDPKLFYPELE